MEDDMITMELESCWSGIGVIGTLEWQEKPKPNDAGQRMTRSLLCNIVIGPDEHDMWVMSLYW